MTRHNRRTRLRGAWATLVLAPLLLAACGGADAADSPASASGAVLAIASTTGATPETSPVLPVTVTDAKDHAVTVASADRIIPLDGDVAEIVFALGLGDRVGPRPTPSPRSATSASTRSAKPPPSHSMSRVSDCA